MAGRDGKAADCCAQVRATRGVGAPEPSAGDAQLTTAQGVLQNTLASNAVTYGSGGFVTPANYVAYDAAIQAAFTARQAAIVAALALIEN